MKKSAVLALGIVAMFAAGSAAEAAGLTVCQMKYTLRGWSALYKVANGSGTITCTNGQTANVRIEARGGGLTAGRSRVRDGHGSFSEVSDINELFGSYIVGEAGAGAGNSADAMVMTKGEVSLALVGTGTGVELGVSVGKFTIAKR
jgi:hypothetical protein